MCWWNDSGGNMPYTMAMLLEEQTAEGLLCIGNLWSPSGPRLGCLQRGWEINIYCPIIPSEMPSVQTEAQRMDTVLFMFEEKLCVININFDFLWLFLGLRLKRHSAAVSPGSHGRKACTGNHSLSSLTCSSPKPTLDWTLCCRYDSFKSEAKQLMMLIYKQLFVDDNKTERCNQKTLF